MVSKMTKSKSPPNPGSRRTCSCREINWRHTCSHSHSLVETETHCSQELTKPRWQKKHGAKLCSWKDKDPEVPQSSQWHLRTKAWPFVIPRLLPPFELYYLWARVCMVQDGYRLLICYTVWRGCHFHPTPADSGRTPPVPQSCTDSLGVLQSHQP